MTHRILFLVFLSRLLWSQPETTRCCTCESSARPEDVVCLGAKEMRDHVDHLEPLKPSGLHKGLNLAGIVVVEIRFDSEGKVACAHAKSGHPIAIAAAMTAVKRWSFRPIMLGDVAKGGCGVVTIKYRLRDHGSSTKLQ